jgi:flagellar hook protein FlgE
MISALYTVLRGMQCSQTAIQVAAENIANLNTDGYRSVRYEPSSNKVGLRDPGVSMDGDQQRDVPVNDVDPAREVVELISNKHAFQANVLSAKIADETTGTLLDLMAE